MNEYIGRVNQVIDYIEANLHRSFTLDELASVAHFSKFHFHRLFLSLMGETLFRFIQRVRLERAANRLVFEPDSTVTAVGLDVGFSSTASFSKSFKEHFKISPSEWRRKSLYGNQLQSNSNLGQRGSNQLKDYADTLVYLGIHNGTQKWELSAKGSTRMIEVYERPATEAVYVRHIGPYQQDVDLFENLNKKLFAWAAPRGLVDYRKTEYFIIAHDDPDITDNEKLRISVCLTVDKDVEVDGMIGKMKVPGGSYAHIKFQLKPADIGSAWNWIYGCWLPISGFIPDDRPCLERYPLDGSYCGADEPVDFEICIPVKPL